MKRAAEYGRQSTDLQNDKSVEDQSFENIEYIKRKEYVHVASYGDRGISGAFILNRPGILQAIQDAKNGKYDVLVAEHPDRLSRSTADMAMLFQQLRFYGVEIECLSGGVLTAMSASLYGMVGQEMREGLAPKVRRGHAAVLRDGRVPAGLSYGYDPTPGRPGVHRVNQEQAKCVRLIFESFIAGWSPRKIAERLNKLGFPPPRGGLKWMASTINGNPKRGTGILCNTHYIGRVIYNRNHYPKDPETGKRVARPNNDEEIREGLIESLRIIDDDTFNKAQEIRQIRSHKGSKNSRIRKKPRILSGLLRCSECGGGMSIGGSDSSGTRVRCSTHKESGICSNSKQYYLRKIDALVIGALQSVLSDERLAEDYVSAYRQEFERAHGASRNDRARIEKELRATERSISVLVEKIAMELITDAEAALFLRRLRDKAATLRQEFALADHALNYLEIDTQGIRRHSENIANLASIVGEEAEEIDPAIMTAFRDLVAAVIVFPRERGDAYTIRIVGHLSALTTGSISNSAVTMAERAGFEPAISCL